MDQGFADSLKKHYCFYTRKYVLMKPSYTKTVSHYFTDEVLKSHLDGRYAIGVFAGEKATKFISFDIDIGGHSVVKNVVDTLELLGFPRDRIYVSTSGKKGYHVDMFFDPYIYNERARNIYELVIWQAQLDPKKVEFRPTHKQAIKLPLGIHAKTGNRCWFVDRETLEPIERMDYISEIQHINAAMVYDILRIWNKKRWSELYIEAVLNPKTDPAFEPEYDYRRKEEYFENHKLTEPGTRHNMMVRIATDIRYCGAGQKQIEKFLMGWYYRQDPGLMDSSEDEVREDAQEIAEWAAENVPIVRNDAPPPSNKPITIDKNDISRVLMGSTKTTRLTALLIITYCKMYGAAKISYASIADTVGCVEASAKTAVNELIRKRVIFKQSGGMHVFGGKMIKKSNVYFILSSTSIVPPEPVALLCESFEYGEPYDKNNFYHYYCRVLGGLCTDGYLAKFVTKPELADIQEARRNADDQSPCADGCA